MEQQVIDQLSQMRLGEEENVPQAEPVRTNEEFMREVVQRVIRQMTANEEPVVREGQVVVNASNANELDRIPDMVKGLREFSGRIGEFNSWRKSVDRILDAYKNLKDTPRYFAILHTIRHKIVGDADTALESYRTPLDWPLIKKCLMLHYSDKRDIGTLEYQMTIMTQRHYDIATFYQMVYQHLSLILDKVACLDVSEEAIRAMTNSYREKALDTFIRGLNGDLPRLLSIREPATLPQALHLCQKLDNMNFRLNYAHGANKLDVNMIRYKPPRHPLPFRGQRFYPELAYVPPAPHRYNVPQQPFNKFNRHNQPQFNHPQFNPRFQQRHNGFGTNQPVRPNYANYNNQPSPSPKPPVPMDIDSSMQTRQGNNYSAPIPNYNFKRAHSGQVTHPPNKIQRNFHLNAAYPYEEEVVYDYPDTNFENLAQAEADPNKIFSETEPIPQHYTLNGDDNDPESDTVNFLD